MAERKVDGRDGVNRQDLPAAGGPDAAAVRQQPQDGGQGRKQDQRGYNCLPLFSDQDQRADKTDKDNQHHICRILVPVEPFRNIERTVNYPEQQGAAEPERRAGHPRETAFCSRSGGDAVRQRPRGLSGR